MEKKEIIQEKTFYTDAEKISEVSATLCMEGLQLDDNDIQMLNAIKSENRSTYEMRSKILSEI